jgi:hypothetical protein
MRPVRYQVTLVDPETGKQWRHTHESEEAANDEAMRAQVYGLLADVEPVMSLKEPAAS